MPGTRRFPLPLIAAFFALYVIWGSTYLVIRIGVDVLAAVVAGGDSILHGGCTDVWLPQMARRASADVATMEGRRDDRHFAARPSAMAASRWPNMRACRLASLPWR